MKLIVTGALGHIGSKLIRKLADLYPGCEIVLIDNLSTQRYTSLFNLPITSKYRFIEGDVLKIELNEIIRGAAAVIHLAAITDAASSFDREAEVERVNLTGTMRVADACCSLNVPMIHASSTSVYGSQEDKVDELCSFESLKPQSPYAHTKLKEEEYITLKVRESQLKAVIFRFGTIFGTSPGIRFHTAVNKFCWQAVMGVPITIWKTAYDQKRPYLDIDDCIRAIAFVIDNNCFDGNVYNVVTQNLTVKDVVKAIEIKLGKLNLEFVEHKIMNQLSYEVLNTRLAEMGFQVEGSLENAIDETVKLIIQSNSN